MILQILTKEFCSPLVVKCRQINQIRSMCESCEFGLHHPRIVAERPGGCVCRVLLGGGKPFAALVDGVHGLHQLLER